MHGALLIVALVGIASLCGWLLDGGRGIVVALLLAAAAVAMSPRVSPRLMLRMVRARPLPRAECRDIYKRLAAIGRRAGLEHLPALTHVPSPGIGALSLGDRDRSAIAITDGLLTRLTLRELTGILAHEIAHIRNRDLAVIALAEGFGRVAHTISAVGLMLVVLSLPMVLLHGAGATPVPWSTVLMLLAAPVAADLLMLALLRTREFEADRTAADLTGDPLGLAAALGKVEQLQAGLLRRLYTPRSLSVTVPPLLRTHPETRERIRRLRALAGGADAG